MARRFDKLKSVVFPLKLPCVGITFDCFQIKYFVENDHVRLQCDVFMVLCKLWYHVDNLHRYPTRYRYYMVSFSNTGQNGRAVRRRHTFYDRARPGASRVSHISTCVTVGAGVLKLCLPTFPPSLSLPSYSIFAKCPSSDPLHDRIGGVN